MKRRLLFRFALASAALYGCASVLGIDELPVPDADGGAADGSPVVDAPTETSTADATLSDSAPAETGTDDAGDAGPLFFVIQPNSSFDPSAVFWNQDSGTLYIANNGGPSGHEIDTWIDVDAGDASVTTFSNVASIGTDRFGQFVSGLPDEMFLTAHGATTGDLVDIHGNETFVQTFSFAIYGATFDRANETIYLTEARAAAGELVSFFAAQDVPSLDDFAPVPEHTIGVVAHDSTIIVAGGDGELFQVATTSGGKQTDFGSIGRDAGYMIDGPDGALLVGGGSVIRVVTMATPTSAVVILRRPDGNSFQNLGAFSYDFNKKRLFVPEGAVDGGAGRVIVFPLQ